MRTLVRFRDLKARNIVHNWPQLSKLIEKEGFPPGFKLSANTRAWFEDDIETWLDTRPTAASVTETA